MLAAVANGHRASIVYVAGSIVRALQMNAR
jgi:hypothetical protein